MIRFTDPGGEYYFSLTLATSGLWIATSNASLSNSAPTGRSSTYGISLNSAGGAQSIDTAFFQGLQGNFASLIMGGAWYVPSVGGGFGTQQIVGFLDGGSNQVDVRITSGGTLQITRNGTVLGTSSNALVSGQGWVYVEFVATINSSTGSAQVFVNGVSWLSVSGVNTQATGNATASRARYGTEGNSHQSWWKDMYVLDTGTGVNTTRLGDVTVSSLYPNSAGPKQDFSNTGGASQTVSVQDGISHTGTWPDGDTTYISDSVSGHISDFNHQTIGAGTIYCVVHSTYARSDAGAANFQQYTNSSGNIHTTSNIAAGGSYVYNFDVQEQDNNTSAQWTQSGLNSATFGVKIP